MVDWRKLEAAVDRKVGGAFGETVRLSFLVNGKTDPDYAFRKRETTAKIQSLDVYKPVAKTT